MDILDRPELKSHGVYGVEGGNVVCHAWGRRFTPYAVIQHEYAGHSVGYLEVLEFPKPPDGHCGIVVHRYCLEVASPSTYTEWSTLDHAKAAFQRLLAPIPTTRRIEDMPGFLRHVDCGQQSPWFYPPAPASQ